VSYVARSVVIVMKNLTVGDIIEILEGYPLDAYIHIVEKYGKSYEYNIVGVLNREEIGDISTLDENNDVLIISGLKLKRHNELIWSILQSTKEGG